MKNYKILLMEDDIDLGETLKDILELNSYDVTLASDGVEASEFTYHNSYDIYVFDINVPQFNGLELLDSLRNSMDKTPTIFISAFIDLNTISKAFKVGADDYIKKPFFPEELLLRIELKLDKKDDCIIYDRVKYYPKEDILFLDLKEIYLSKMQMELFKVFINNLNKKVLKEDIMDRASINSPSALRVAINKLKNTTGLNIKNLHGIGYILEES
jgi:DNA-binding response OmpR family regulator